MAPKKRAASTDAGSSSKKRKTPATPDQKARGAKNAKGDLGDKAEADDLVDEMQDTPLAQLNEAMMEHAKRKKDGVFAEKEGNAIVYWMRMKDLRIKDNRALALASAVAKEQGKHLVALHVLSPGDYKSHDRSAIRIDFVLRNLKWLQVQFAELNIPLHVMSVEPRKTIPQKVVDWTSEIGGTAIYANIEYEVDELRRDKFVLDAAEDVSIDAMFCKDVCIVEPGKILTKQGKPYSVYSPWFKNWTATVSENMLEYVEDVGEPAANDDSIRKDSKLKALFDCKIPDSVKGFELDKAKKEHAEIAWPAGTAHAEERLRKFISNKARPSTSDFATRDDGPEVGPGKSGSRIAEYNTGRNRPDINGTSRISPYLAAGVLSLRSALRATLPLTKNKLMTERNSGIGMFNGELAWKDFYTHVLAAWPRVCMRKPFILKYEKVVWEKDDKLLEAWKTGQTGYPIVDAAMRQIQQEGYVHNRCRMIVAMFLTKDLMMDWKIGEQYFMQNLIDGDFASNNGGWQWSASTGTDPQPYFRIFNMTAQSEKSDLTGDYIRHYVPELKSLKGAAVHDPHSKLSSKEFAKLGYPAPIVDHKSARKRALARYKVPGCADDE